MGQFVQVKEVGPLLYRSWSDFPVHRFSYSIAKDIDECGVKTKFSRFQGLAPIVESAALKFGICIEEAVRDHYQFFVDPVAAFKLKWKQYEKFTLKYSKTDGNWETLNSIGAYLMKEFLLQRNDLPIASPEFGVVLPKDLKQTWYNGTRLEYTADCISHTLEGDFLFDFKTAGRSYPEKDETQGYAALDPQLRTGALVSGIRNVGFIVFVKTKSPRIQVSYGTVTDFLIEQIDLWLKEQYHKLIEGRLHMRTGVRFPNEQCLNCDFLPKCLGREDIAAQTLRQKESKETEDLLASLE
jgi:hypothetical protein